MRKKNTFEPKEQGSSPPLSPESGTFLSLFLSLSLSRALAQVTTMADSPLVSRYSRGVQKISLSLLSLLFQLVFSSGTLQKDHLRSRSKKKQEKKKNWKIKIKVREKREKKMRELSLIFFLFSFFFWTTLEFRIRKYLIRIRY